MEDGDADVSVVQGPAGTAVAGCIATCRGCRRSPCRLGSVTRLTTGGHPQA